MHTPVAYRVVNTEIWIPFRSLLWYNPWTMRGCRFPSAVPRTVSQPLGKVYIPPSPSRGPTSFDLRLKYGSEALKDG